MRYPLTITNLSGRVAVVVGGGIVGERKVRSLLAADVPVRLISPSATEQLVPPGPKAARSSGRAGSTEKGTWTTPGWSLPPPTCAPSTMKSRRPPTGRELSGQRSRRAGRGKFPLARGRAPGRSYCLRQHDLRAAAQGHFRPRPHCRASGA